MKLVKFTNLAEAHHGNPVYINPDWIVAVFETETADGNIKTIIYGGPVGTSWEVAESPEEVKKIIEKVL